MFERERKKKGLWWDAALRINSGCTKVSPGCDHCWAESELAIRSNSPNPKIAAQWPGNFSGDVHLLPDNLEKVLKAKTPKAWAVWNDLFHKDIPDEYRDRVLGAFAVAQKQLGIILTKRPDQMAGYFVDTGEARCAMIANAADLIAKEQGKEYCPIQHLPLNNIWLGTSAGDQQRLEERARHLLQCPAAVLFLSIEPMLAEMDIKPYVNLRMRCAGDKGCGYTGPSYEFNGKKDGSYACPKCRKNHTYFMTNSVDWVIVGAESRGGGIGRQCKVEWVRSIVAQCKAAGVPVFVKQLHIDGKLVKETNKFPEDLRLRQVPAFNL